jgi:hypothetical protein
MARQLRTALGIAASAVAIALAVATLPAAAQVTGAAPDLVPVANRILNGVVSVRNAGSANAGAFVVTVQCQKQGGGSCADHPGLAAYEDPAYPNRVVVKVPSLAKGQVFNHNLRFWNELEWQPGTYNFLLEADAGKNVGEINEGNNFGGAVLVK